MNAVAEEGRVCIEDLASSVWRAGKECPGNAGVIWAGNCSILDGSMMLAPLIVLETMNCHYRLCDMYGIFHGCMLNEQYKRVQ